MTPETDFTWVRISDAKPLATDYPVLVTNGKEIGFAQSPYSEDESELSKMPITDGKSMEFDRSVTHWMSIVLLPLPKPREWWICECKGATPTLRVYPTAQTFRCSQCKAPIPCQRSFSMKKGSTVKRNKRLLLTHSDAWQASGWLMKGRHWHKLDPFPSDHWQLTVRKELDIDEKGQPL